MNRDISLEIAHKIALDLGLPISHTLLMAESQSAFTVHIMKRGLFENIMLPYFGKFIVSKGNLRKVNNLKLIKTLR